MAANALKTDSQPANSGEQVDEPKRYLARRLDRLPRSIFKDASSQC